jgi:hypothetical protein
MDGSCQNHGRWSDMTSDHIRRGRPVSDRFKRCTVVDVERLLRCLSYDGHGSYHEFSTNAYARQDLCLSQIINSDTGRLRLCTLPLYHEDACVFLWLTERRVTVADLWRF